MLCVAGLREDAGTADDSVCVGVGVASVAVCGRGRGRWLCECEEGKWKGEWGRERLIER